MSFSKRARDLQSSKFAQKKRKKIIGLLIIIILVIVVLSGLFVLVLRLPFLQIKQIEVFGTDLSTPTEVRQIVESVLDKPYFDLVTRRNIFFFPKGEIESKLQESLKSLKTVSLRRKLFSTLKIEVTEKKPEAIVCEGFREEIAIEEGKCFFVDENGYIFARQASSTSLLTEKKIIYYLSTAKEESMIDSYFMPTEKFQPLKKFLEGTVKAGMEPLGVLVGETGQYELYLSHPKGATTSPEITVYFDDRSSLDKTLENFISFWRESKTANFDSINLRYGNTIYYLTR